LNSAFRRYLPLSLTLLIIFLDRLTKQIVVNTMDLHESIPFIGETVKWTFIHNDGMVFGFDIIGGKVLGVISLFAVLIVLIVLMRTDKEPVAFRWILAAVLGGAIGNTYDRITLGYVVDFVDVDMPDFIMDRFAVFNVADSAISVGVVLLMILILVYDKRMRQEVSLNEEMTSDEPSVKEELIESEGVSEEKQ